MIRCNLHILKYFTELNRLSAFRLYLYVKEFCNNHLHEAGFDSISQHLNISKQTILRNLKQLEELDVCIKYSSGYWRFRSWKKWSPTSKNRIILINLDTLKDLKALRTLNYITHYRSAVRMSKKNSKVNKRQNSGGFYKASASFVQSVTGINRTTQTLLKHLKRGEFYKFCEVIRHYDILFQHSTLEFVQLCKKSIDIPCFIKKNSTGFVLIAYSANKVRISI